MFLSVPHYPGPSVKSVCLLPVIFRG